jgi:hypothetical protein
MAFPETELSVKGSWTRSRQTVDWHDPAGPTERLGPSSPASAALKRVWPRHRRSRLTGQMQAKLRIPPLNSSTSFAVVSLRSTAFDP